MAGLLASVIAIVLTGIVSKNAVVSDFLREGHTNWVRTIAFSFDGQTLVSGSYD